MWLTIINGLLAFLGPILADAFREWLEGKLKRAAAGPAFYGTDGAAKIELLRRVREDLWFWQVGKKRAVDQCIEAVKVGSTKSFSVIGDQG